MKNNYSNNSNSSNNNSNNNRNGGSKHGSRNHSRRGSIDMSGNGNNSNSNNNNSSNNNNNNNSNGNGHGREDSLSKKSLSEMLRGGRLFRSSSTPDHSNRGSKNHSREHSLVGNNGNNNGTPNDALPENDATILPMPSEMLTNKERLNEPPQPRNVGNELQIVD